MASYEKLDSGKHSYVVRLPNGQRKRFTDKMQRVARSDAADFEARLRRGEALHLRDRRVTVAGWHAKWMARRMVDTSTARKDESRWRTHVEPKWGGWPLAAIERGHVQEWIVDLGKAGVGPHAVAGAYELLGTILSAAADEGLIHASPCRKIKLPKAGKPEPRWFTHEEYDRLQLALGSAMTTRGRSMKVPDPQAHVWQALVGLACYSGLRPGELAGLDVSAIDFDRQLVRVTQVVTRLPDGVGEDGKPKYRYGLRAYPKSDRSVRSVPFPEHVGEMLWRVVADRAAGPVFAGVKGARINYEGNWRKRVWVPALEAAGIEPVRPYAMRHTCASWLVQEGVPDRQIMKILGHADTHLIECYAHLAPDAHDAVRAAWVREGSFPTSAPRDDFLPSVEGDSAGQRRVKPV